MDISNTLIEEIIDATSRDEIIWTHKRLNSSSRFRSTYKDYTMEFMYVFYTNGSKYHLLVSKGNDQMLVSSKIDNLENLLDKLHTTIVSKNNKYMNKDNP